jgi:hypothetical protein
MATRLGDLFEPGLAERLYKLTRKVLTAREQQSPAGDLRFFGHWLPEGSAEEQTDFVLGLLFGNPSQLPRPCSIRQRFAGIDAIRMLRAPVVILAKPPAPPRAAAAAAAAASPPPVDADAPPDFPSSFVQFLQRIGGGTDLGRVQGQQADVSQPHDSPLLYPLAIFQKGPSYDAVVNDLAVFGASKRIENLTAEKTNDKSARVLYLTAEQKLVFLFLHLLSKDTREQMTLEAVRPLFGNGGWHGVESAIIRSVRVQLYPFLRWLQVVDQSEGDYPKPTDAVYLPVCEDNHVLSLTFGRLFDDLFSCDVVHHVLHLQSMVFVNVPDQRRAPAGLVVADHAPFVMVLLFYAFYKSICWKFNRKHKGMVRLEGSCSFLAFVRIAVRCLFIADEQKWPLNEIFGDRVMPCMTVAFRQLREAVNAGSIDLEARQNVVAEFLGIPQGRCNMRADRFMTGLLQIAFVLEKRKTLKDARVKEKRWPDIEPSTWAYFPVGVLHPMDYAQLKNSTVLTNSARLPVERPKNDRALLIKGVSAEWLRLLLARPLQMPAELLRVHLEFHDACHPVLTNGEVSTVVVTSTHVNALPLLRLYAWGAAIDLRGPDTVHPFDPQMLLSYAGALMRGQLVLFHWLLCWRGTLSELIDQARVNDQVEERKIDFLDSDSDDEEEQKVPERPLHWTPLRLLTDRVWIRFAKSFFTGAFFATLLRAAARVPVVEGNPTCVAEVVARIHWLLFEDVAVTIQGYQRLVRDPAFMRAFEESRFWTHGLTEEQRQCISVLKVSAISGVVDIPVGDMTDAVVFEATAKTFTENGVALPCYLKLDHDAKFVALQRVAKLLQSDEPNEGVSAFLDLRGWSVLPKKRLKRCMPWMSGTDWAPPLQSAFEHGTRDCAPVVVVNDRLSEEERSDTDVATGQVLDCLVSPRLLRECPAQRALDVKAVLDQNAFFRPRQMAEIFLPAHGQDTVFSSQEVPCAVALVKQLFHQQGDAGQTKLDGVMRRATVLQQGSSSAAAACARTVRIRGRQQEAEEESDDPKRPRRSVSPLPPVPTVVIPGQSMAAAAAAAAGAPEMSPMEVNVDPSPGQGGSYSPTYAEYDAAFVTQLDEFPNPDTYKSPF